MKSKKRRKIFHKLMNKLKNMSMSINPILKLMILSVLESIAALIMIIRTLFLMKLLISPNYKVTRINPVILLLLLGQIKSLLKRQKVLYEYYRGNLTKMKTLIKKLKQ